MSLQLKNYFTGVSLEQRESSKLSCGLADVDHFMEGGLSFGQVSEWGIPWGSGGRGLILHFLAEATKQNKHCLWVHDRKDLAINPPSWQSMGVDLSYVRVAVSSQEKRKRLFGQSSRKSIYARAIEDLTELLNLEA